MNHIWICHSSTFKSSLNRKDITPEFEAWRKAKQAGLPEKWYVQPITDEEVIELRQLEYFASHPEEVPTIGRYHYFPYTNINSQGEGWLHSMAPGYIVGYVEITMDQFRKAFLEDKQETDQKFPVMITTEQAKYLIESHDPHMQIILAGEWALEVVLKEGVEVSQEIYTKMREGADKIQHEILDEVFGPDKPKHTFKKGDLVWVKDLTGEVWHVRYFSHVLQKGYATFGDQEKSGLTIQWEECLPFNECPLK